MTLFTVGIGYGLAVAAGLAIRAVRKAGKILMDQISRHI